MLTLKNLQAERMKRTTAPPTAVQLLFFLFLLSTWYEVGHCCNCTCQNVTVVVVAEPDDDIVTFSTPMDMVPTTTARIATVEERCDYLMTQAPGSTEVFYVPSDCYAVAPGMTYEEAMAFCASLSVLLGENLQASLIEEDVDTMVLTKAARLLGTTSSKYEFFTAGGPVVPGSSFCQTANIYSFRNRFVKAISRKPCLFNSDGAICKIMFV